MPAIVIAHAAGRLRIGSRYDARRAYALDSRRLAWSGRRAATVPKKRNSTKATGFADPTTAGVLSRQPVEQEREISRAISITGALQAPQQ